MTDTAPIESPELTPENPGYTHEDLAKESIRDIAANTKEPDITDDPELKKIVEEELTVDEVVKKAADETAAAMLKAQEEKDRAVEEARLAAEEAAKIPVKPQDEYQAIVDEFTQNEGRTPTWDELAVKIEERTLAKLEAKQQATIEENKAKAEVYNKAQTEEAQRLNSFVDDEMADLYKAGKLTPIKDPKNPSDQGVLERKELFRQWGEVNKQRLAEGKPEIISATRIHDFYYKKPSAQPANGDAPIAGNKANITPPSAEEGYTYADLQKPWWVLGRK